MSTRVLIEHADVSTEVVHLFLLLVLRCRRKEFPVL